MKNFFFTGWVTSRSPVYFRKHMNFMTYQLEKGKQKGRLHWQGVVVMKNDVSANCVQSLLGNGFWITECHSLRNAIRYCRKSESKQGLFQTFGTIKM